MSDPTTVPSSYGQARAQVFPQPEPTTAELVQGAALFLAAIVAPAIIEGLF